MINAEGGNGSKRTISKENNKEKGVNRCSEQSRARFMCSLLDHIRKAEEPKGVSVPDMIGQAYRPIILSLSFSRPDIPRFFFLRKPESLSR
jgi:hypothetical protein